MNKLLSKCPVCAQELRVTGLECSHCGTEIRGQFELGRFARLGADRSLVHRNLCKKSRECLSRRRGVGNSILGGCARLTEIILALGYDSENEVREEQGLPPERRKAILEQVSSGKITSEQVCQNIAR